MRTAEDQALDKAAQAEHCERFLELLRGAEEVPASTLASISRNHTARISQLRAKGWDIRCRFGDGRQTFYRLYGRKGEGTKKVLQEVSCHLAQPIKLTVRRAGKVSVPYFGSPPVATERGFEFTFPSTLRLEPGDVVEIEVLDRQTPSVAFAAKAA